MAGRASNSADARWLAAGIGAAVLTVALLIGAIVVAHGRPDEPMPVVSSAPLGNEQLVQIAVIADSSPEAITSDGVKATGWPELVFRQLRKEGFDIAVHTSDQQGSGYVAHGKKGTTFKESAHSLLKPYDGLVIVFGGTHDASEKPESVAAAVSDTFSVVRTSAPRAKLIAVGPISDTADPGPDMIRVRDIVRQEAEKDAATFVDPIADRWFVGSHDPVAEDTPAARDARQTYLADRLQPIIEHALASAN
ncbi:MAG: SGNH/GDSL hydrolase family protein [Mycobacterium sp.]|nr:SGNH/GDSL hydrolase family protein [Mycobacterium sp.]